MKLVVKVVEARNLPALDQNGLRDPYVKLQLGKRKYKTKVVKKCLNPSWGDEFRFKVDDLKEELVVNVLDEDKFFNDDIVGQVKVPVSQVFDADDKSLGTNWYPLQPKTKKSKNKLCGEILLNVYFSRNNMNEESDGFGDPLMKHDDISSRSSSRTCSRSNSPSRLRPDDTVSNSKEEKNCMQKKFSGRIAQIFNKNSDNKNLETVSVSSSTKSLDFFDLPEISEIDVPDDKAEEQSNFGSFEEAMKTMESRDQGSEIPSNLPGGILLDQLYSDQIYLKVDGKEFAVLSSVFTPDVTFGNNFRTEVLYCIMPGPELPSNEQCSHLVISWRMNFLQNTMMRSMIESGAQKGLKSSFEQFGTLLSQQVKPVESKDVGVNKDQLLGSLDAVPESDWKLALQYLANFTVVSTFFMGLYVIVHIWLVGPSMIQGLEFFGLDLPDSIGEFIVSGILVLQGERVLGFISRFMHARVQRGGDHGVKAQGDGWLLTVALIEGNNLAAVDSSGFCDPYVVFSCNGKTKTSSIKFQKSNPQWNEIFEFDAMDEPPSVLDVEVYDFDGPFDEAASLGHAEVNFVKSNLADLADVWIPLQGKLAQACQSKLRLRIFLNNTKGSSVVKEYLNKMEKEVGKKLNLRSPQTNSAFQKLFALPPEEFLINDFTCHLKRKMPVQLSNYLAVGQMQGRLFLSPRIIGFHANLFGQKTNFFFLWEDIEDILVSPATLASMGSPILLITLRKGRGLDAKHGAKTRDAEGRLKFHFQSFVSFNAAHRTIIALWKSRSLSPEQKVQIVEEESDVKNIETEENGLFLGDEDVNMTEIISSTPYVPVNSHSHILYDPVLLISRGAMVPHQSLDLHLLVNFFMEVFGGEELDHRIMEKVGCLDYYFSPWESETGEVLERTVYYKFDKRISRYRGEVTSTQQKSRIPDRNGWIVEEVMTLHGVPLGDYFDLHLKFQVEDVSSRPNACQVKLRRNMHPEIADSVILFFDLWASRGADSSINVMVCHIE
ncbi:hypothetical protein ACFE04_000936 [Oxalis oulophora]